RSWSRSDRVLLRILLELAGEAEIRRDSVKSAVVPQVDECLVGLAQVGRGCDQRVENGLQVECRAANDLEHVGGGGLLLIHLLHLLAGLPQSRTEDFDELEAHVRIVAEKWSEVLPLDHRKLAVRHRGRIGGARASVE